MNRYEAIQALFGDDPTKACQEAVDVLMDAMVLDDADLENLSGQVTDAFDVFCEDKQKAVRQLEKDDPRLPFYKQLAGEIEEAEDEDEAPADEPLNKPPVTGLKGILDFVSSQPDGHEEIGGVDDETEEEEETVDEKPDEEASSEDVPDGMKEFTALIKNEIETRDAKIILLEGELAAAKQESADAAQKLVTATQELEAVKQQLFDAANPYFEIVSVPAIVQHLLRSPSWIECRKKIELSFGKSLSSNSDPHVCLIERSEGRRELVDMAAYMRVYASGDCGADKITHGRHALECIEKLNEGIDPKSEWYLTRFVDGKERKRNNPDSSDS